MGINEGVAADGQRQIQKGRGQYDGFAKTVKTGLNEPEKIGRVTHFAIRFRNPYDWPANPENRTPDP